MILATAIGGFLLTVQAADVDTESGDESLTDQPMNGYPIHPGFVGEGLNRRGFGRGGFIGGQLGGLIGEFRDSRAIELSEEFEQKVTSIVESDSDVQDLLAEGYSISAIRPSVKRVVDSEGYLTTKVTNAMVILHKDASEESGHASITVDLESEKVTQIIILTRTVIDKS